MNRVCRKVDGERAECTGCGKQLTLRVLAYKHAKSCQPYKDRVAKRSAQAHERYQHALKRKRGEAEANLDEDDDTTTSTTASSTDSENTQISTRKTSQASSQALFKDNSGEGQFELTSLHKNHKNTFEGQIETTSPHKIHEYTSEIPFEATSPHKIHEYTSETPFEATFPPKILEKTSGATNKTQKTQEITPGIALQSKKTLRVTHGRTLHPELDNKITGMFQYIHMLSYQNVSSKALRLKSCQLEKNVHQK